MSMGNFIRKSLCFMVTLGLLLLSGCHSGPALYHQTEGNVADVAQLAVDARHKSDEARPKASLLIDQGLYVDRTPIDLAHKPSWLKNKIILRGENLPFSYYTRLIVNGGARNVLTRFQVGLDPTVKVSMNYTGTVQGALDQLSSKVGYIYSINGNNVYWQSFVTKTFDIAFMPGTSDYMMGKAGKSTTAASGASGGTTTTAIVDDSADSMYSNLKGNLSIWKDLEATIRPLLSSDGRVIVSEATTTVTVRDRPGNVQLVGRFINNLNNNLTKQVLVKVEVLEVTLSSDYTFGINWNLIQRSFLGKQNFVLNAPNGNPVSFSRLDGGAFPSIGISPMNGPNQGANAYTALVNALTQQGKVSVVSQPRLVCLNNQVSTLRIVNQIGYLAGVQNTTVPSNGTSTALQNTVTTQLTPGTLVTGLTLYILPKILGEKVYLQINADLSNSPKIDTISSTTGGVPPPGNNTPILQVPRVTQKQFNQRSVIASGDTLILSGFRQISNQVGATQTAEMQALGGKGASQSNAETIVLITPVILNGAL